MGSDFANFEVESFNPEWWQTIHLDAWNDTLIQKLDWERSMDANYMLALLLLIMRHAMLWPRLRHIPLFHGSRWFILSVSYQGSETTAITPFLSTSAWTDEAPNLKELGAKTYFTKCILLTGPQAKENSLLNVWHLSFKPFFFLSTNFTAAGFFPFIPLVS